MSGDNSTFDGRIGEKMTQAVKRVDKNGPYKSKRSLAISVGPNGSEQYGYSIVDRCLHRDLLKLEEDHEHATPNGKGAVVLTQKGQRFINWLDEGGDTNE